MVGITTEQRDLLALCSLTMGEDRCDWGVIARQAYREQSLEGLLSGEVVESGARARRTGWVAATATEGQWASAFAQADREVEAAGAVGARLTTVFDDDYPVNLRFIHNLPPFVFYRGALDAGRDARSVAVVGTRKPSLEGIRRAERMASALAERDIAVTSGLAEGIDSAAHRATVAHGGRTIAVYGTGITRIYPKSNMELVDEILSTGGLVVSQFFPTAQPAQWTFRKRNEVTSGISQGTVVIEASKTSGAKMQARLAYEHGKRVFLIKSLVTEQDWAMAMVDSGQATEVESVEDIVPLVADSGRLRAASGELLLQPSML